MEVIIKLNQHLGLIIVLKKLLNTLSVSWHKALPATTKLLHHIRKIANPENPGEDNAI